MDEPDDYFATVICFIGGIEGEQDDLAAELEGREKRPVRGCWIASWLDCDVSLVRRWNVSKSIEGMLREVRDRERCGGRVVRAVARLFSIPRSASKDSLTITLDRAMVPSFGKQSVWRLLLYEYIVEVEFRSKILGELLVPTVELQNCIREASHTKTSNAANSLIKMRLTKEAPLRACPFVNISEVSKGISCDVTNCLNLGFYPVPPLNLFQPQNFQYHNRTASNTLKRSSRVRLGY